MIQYKVDERVRLVGSLPDLSLEGGSEGVVQSVWASAHEVEFKVMGLAHCLRALLLPEQLQPAR